MGEWLDKTKLILILISNLVEVVVEAEVELGNYQSESTLKIWLVLKLF